VNKKIISKLNPDLAASLHLGVLVFKQRMRAKVVLCLLWPNKNKD